MEDKQIWVTETAGRYDLGSAPDSPEDAKAPCRLHEFIDAREIAPEDPPGTGIHPDARRVDIYMQYLYQTDVDPDRPLIGYDSGLLDYKDEDQSGTLDEHRTYFVFDDWSKFSHKEGDRPQRSWYEDHPLLVPMG